MSKKKIGAYIALDGEKEFRSAVTSCNKSLSTMKSEMKLVEAQTTGQANTLETLRKKHDVLSRTLDEQVKKESAVRTALEHSQNEYERVGSELTEYKKQLDNASNVLEEMRNNSDATEESLKEQQDAVDNLKKAVEKGEQTYQRAEDRVKNWQKQLNTAEAQTIRATKALQENDAYMQEAENSFTKCAKSIDEFGKQTDSLAEKLTSTGNVIKVNLINSAVDLGKTMTLNAAKGVLELQDAQNKLCASTNATADEMQKYNQQIEELYKDGYGDSVSDLADNMALVRQYTGEIDASKIKELTENAMALDDTFENMDLSETIRGVDSLMTNMGLSAEEAFDYIVTGAQNGLNKSGELTDNIAEYGQLWGQAGFSAQEMFTILDNGLSSGAYNLDKVNDFVKEFGNSLADGRIESSLSSFSEETQELFWQWKEGEASTRDVFYSVINDLQTMTNQQEALTLASNTWSALGEDNAMAIITALDDVNDTYADVKGSMESLKEVRYDSVTNQYKQLGRTVQTDVIQPILVKFLPAAQKGMKLLADNIDTIVPIATTAGVAVGSIYVVNKSRKFIDEVKATGSCVTELGKALLKVAGIQTAKAAVDTEAAAAEGAKAATTAIHTTALVGQTTVTASATAAQSGLNAAMLANPAVLVVGGIVALCSALAVMGSKTRLVANETDELCAKTDELNEKIKDASEGLKESCSNIEESISSLDTKGGIADGLVTELYELEKASDGSEKQIARMSVIVDELNTMFPELSLSIDENTGTLNKNEKQTRSSIQTALEYAKVQAAQEKMAEIAEELADADMARYEAEKNLEEIAIELTELEEERKKLLEESNEVTEESTTVCGNYAARLSDTSDELLKNTERMTELKASQQEQAETLDEMNSLYEQANEKYQEAYGYVESLTEATNENITVTEEKNEQSKASIELAGQELDAYNALSAGQQEMAVNVTNEILTMQESVQGALESQMNMFEKFDGGVKISSEKLLANMQSQIEGVENWEKNLSELADKGINQGILQKLAEMGPEGSGYVKAFNEMTASEIEQANSLWEESLDIKSMTNSWGQELTESGAANIAGGMDELTALMKESGANTVAGLIEGIQEAQSQAETVGKDLGVKTVESIDEGLGCHSPSTKTKESGKNVDMGLIGGMDQGRNLVTKSAENVAKSVVETIDATLDSSVFNSFGYNVSSSLALGIRSGKSAVIAASIEVASAAILATKNKLEIHSPSKPFREMGGISMDSYALGIQERKKQTMESVASAVDFGELSGNVGNRNTNIQMEYGMLGRIIADSLKNIKLESYMDGRKVSRELSRLGVVFSA